MTLDGPLSGKTRLPVPPRVRCRGLVNLTPRPLSPLSGGSKGECLDRRRCRRGPHERRTGPGPGRGDSRHRVPVRGGASLPVSSTGRVSGKADIKEQRPPSPRSQFIRTLVINLFQLSTGGVGIRRVSGRVSPRVPPRSRVLPGLRLGVVYPYLRKKDTSKNVL